MTSAPNSPKTKASRANATMPSRQEFIRAHYRFQEGRFFTAVKLGEDSAFCASDIAVPMWNHSTWFGAAAATNGDSVFGTFVRETEEWHAQFGRRPVIYLIEESEAVV
ncbi:MAG TPA: hypothetical protein VI282_09540, partial [Verrucomicrobiae bacterium]